jgi:putative FmdB family regulatory protein
VPTYSYRCTECTNAFDIHQAFTDDSLSVCPVCSGPLRKIFSAVGVTFNGSGFYRTDSRAAAGSGKGSSSSSIPAGESKSGESKSATPSPASTPAPKAKEASQ